MCDKVVCDKVVCDKGVCDRVVCDKVVCAKVVDNVVCDNLYVMQERTRRRTRRRRTTRGGADLKTRTPHNFVGKNFDPINLQVGMGRKAMVPFIWVDGYPHCYQHLPTI